MARSGLLGAGVSRIENMVKFDSPNDLFLFVEATAQMLKDSGFLDAAHRLQTVNDAFYSTGSEWLGELGLELRNIEQDFKVPKAILGRFATIMLKVNEAWPRI